VTILTDVFARTAVGNLGDFKRFAEVDGMRDVRVTRVCAVAVIGVLHGGAALLATQTPGDPKAAAPPPTAAGHFVSVVAGSTYGASRFHRALLGNEYRDLWLTPIAVEMLDLHHYAGGLEPSHQGGGMETMTLHLESPDGRKFAFRSVNKTHSLTLPPDLRGTTVERLVQDQTSAQHPAAALIVPPLLDAAGVPTARPRMFVMPNDPGLGKFRADFAGMLGTLEERPSSGTEKHAGFAGAREDVETDALYKRLDRDPREHIDSRLFLEALLIDLLVGDPDRAEGQWRWIKRDTSGTAAWVPVPYDRDEAFLRYEDLAGGTLISLGREVRREISQCAGDGLGLALSRPTAAGRSRMGRMGFGGSCTAAEPHGFGHRCGGAPATRSLLPAERR